MPDRKCPKAEIAFFFVLAILLIQAPTVMAMSGDSEDDQVSSPTAVSTISSAAPATLSAPSVAKQGNSTNPISQKAAQLAAAGNYQQGSSFMTSVGIVYCAEGANTIQKNMQMGGLLVDSCLSSFEAANKMKEAELQANQNASKAADNSNLSPNPSVTDSELAQTIFSDFKKSYGIEYEDFEKIMIESKGSANILGEETTLNELFKGKITRSQITEALKAAQKLSPDEREALLRESRIAGITGDFEYNQKSAGLDLNIRVADKSPKNSNDRVGRELSSKQDKSAKENTEIANHSFMGPGITPSDDPLFSNSLEEEPKETLAEPSIFDLVSRKYRQRFKSLFVLYGR